MIVKDAEWLEADGLGGFASGTVSGRRTRRYHAVLLTATTPPTGRVVLVNGFDAWIDAHRSCRPVGGPTGSAGATYPLSAQEYTPGIVSPDNSRFLTEFITDPWPTWTFQLGPGASVVQELLVPKGYPAVILKWHVRGAADGLQLFVRPFLSGRNYHHVHRANPAFRFDADRDDGGVVWQPYRDVPAVRATADGTYRHDPLWYYNFYYQAEDERGLDCVEDLGSPGTFRWDLAAPGGDAVLVLRTPAAGADFDRPAAEVWADFAGRERRRRAGFPTRLERSADAYVVDRGEGKSVIAGYPWFTDWGRDTFISLRGLCLATGRLAVAKSVLLAWAGEVSGGMLPNRFPDEGTRPEFNAVDASLWFVVAVDEFLREAAASSFPLPERERGALTAAVEAILTGYSAGTRYGIRADADGLLAAGAPGVALTWMDAIVDGRPVTPRVGKPVEVQALWLNALRAAGRHTPRWNELYEAGLESFLARFWYAEGGYLYDVVDADHWPGRVDPSLRPNQLFAVGGLPVQLLDGERAKAVVDAAERELWTPVGPRTLGPREPAYCGHFRGPMASRDAAYHQGTAWPWLAGPFVEAWVRVRGSTPAAKAAAREKFVAPLLAHVDSAGLGHVSEVADGDPPHTPGGCPFQAWSLGELLRLLRKVVAGDGEPPVPAE